MALNQAEVEDVRAEFDGVLELMAQEAAGTFRGPPDQPGDAFWPVFRQIVRNPIGGPEHLDLLHRVIAHLMAEQSEIYAGTLDEAVDEALAVTMDRADPLEKALLVLARHQLGQHRLSS